MLNRIAIKLILFFIFIGIMGVRSQNTVVDWHNSIDNSETKKDTSLNGIIYYLNDKANHIIDNVFDVQYDVFLTHYYNKAGIPTNKYYLRLNNEGSAVKNIIFQLYDILDYKRQPNIYEPYIYTPYNIKYYQNKKAYTSLSYSNALNGNQFFTVNFAKNIYRGLNLQTEFFVNYADGEFVNSQVMNQFFNVTLNYISQKGRYRNNVAFIHNRAYTQDNGGIKDDSIFINHEYSKPASYPVLLNKGWNKWKTSEYVFSQSYRLSKSSINRFKTFNKGAIIHSLSFGRYARLYDDENKKITDSLGTNIFRNSLFWTNNIFKKQYAGIVSMSIGLNYDIINFNDSLNSITDHLIVPETKLSFLLGDFNFHAHAISVLTAEDYKKDYHIDIKPTYNFSWKEKNGIKYSYCSMFAEIKIQNKQPDYIFKHYLTENLAWDNEVTKTKTEALSLGIKWAENFTIRANYMNIRDYYCLNSSLQIIKGSTKLYQLQIVNDLSLKRWKFKGVWTLQKVENNDVLHLPLITIKQGLAYSFTWMRGKLKSQAGIDMSYFSSYKADTYNTLTGMYCYQNTNEVGSYVFTDMYLNVAIDRLCLFVMIQHPYSGLLNYSYFNSPFYPAEGFTFRYGLTWKLLD